MANDSSRRVAQLPGFDTSPDVYETPDLDDSTTTTSTLQTSPHEEASSASDTSDAEDDDGPHYGVSRRRLYPERARSRFSAQARGVDTKGTDLSDRVDGKRRGLKIRKGRNWEGDDEGLDARIARLKREVEECRVLAGEKDEEQEQDGDGDDPDETAKTVDALSQLLASIDVTPSLTRANTTTTTTTTENGAKRGHSRMTSDAGQIFHDALPTASPDDNRTSHEGDEHTLSRITTFDTRLAALESALGLSSVLDPSSTSPDLLSTPLLPTLTLLDQQLATLASASSLATLEAASSRIAKLKAEARNLSAFQRTTTSSSDTHSGVDDDDEDDDDDDDEEEDGGGDGEARSTARAARLSPDDAKRLEGLYALLPTLQSLAPTVPALVTRLRSLRTLHTTAATAAGDLDAIEQRQMELDRELKMWREGLERVERAVKEADAANGRNGSFVKGWVDDLEGRVKVLGR